MLLTDDLLLSKRIFVSLRKLGSSAIAASLVTRVCADPSAFMT